MVKADVKRDYYADLELTKDADIAEVKRQFRKLGAEDHFPALKYHPDRNPGHEEEFNAKFQAIQSAHEILTDPTQKARYDADREQLSGGYGARPSVPSRNPYAAYSAYPPPPRRPPARAAATTTAASNPYTTSASSSSSGAGRYSAFARAFGTGRPKEDPHMRTNAYRAFESMNRSANGPRPATNPAPFPPPPRTGNPAAGDPGVPPRVPPRRPGFAPGTPGGDEPPAPTSRYAFGHSDRETRRRRPSSAMPATSTSQTQSTAGVRDGVGGASTNPIDVDMYDGPRLSTPYAAFVGERTCLTPDTMRRSATVREGQSNSAHDRHRSASPLRNRGAQDADRPMGRSKTGPSSPGGSPKRAHADAAKAQEKQQQQHRRGHSHPRASSFAHYVPSDTSSEGERGSDPGSSPPPMATRLAAAGRARERRKPHGRHYPYPTYQPGSVQSNRPTSNGAVNGNVSDGPPRRPAGGRRDGTSSTSQAETNGGNSVPHYTFAVEDERYAPAPPRVPQEGRKNGPPIDTRFTPPDWNGKFTSNTGDYFRSAGNGVTDSSRSSEVSSGAASSTQRTTGASHLNTNGNSSSAFGTSSKGQNAPDFSAQSFKPEFWAEELKQHRWDPPPPSSRRGPGFGIQPRSATRLKTSRSGGFNGGVGKRSTGSKSATVQTPSDESDDEATSSLHPATTTTTGASSSSGGGSSGDGSAMDIDTPNGGRNETSTGTMNPPIIDLTSTTSKPAESSTSHDRPSNVPPLPRRSSATVASNGATTTSLDFNLNSLRQVEPLLQTAHGLGDMGDLQSTLPFPSQAASTPLVSGSMKTYEPQVLELPSPPKAPLHPSTISLTQSVWGTYMATMRVYMFEWTTFVDLMLAHFTERQREAKTSLASAGSGSGLFGDGAKAEAAYLRYMQGVEEDVRVRAHWDVAWERHREVMKAFGAVKKVATQNSLVE
ncbi:MAG: hypothetical protein M1823_005287 [Watsoniomyces obsoletus]|nr:MAG: hypothetical protein M1823_005287 [Watsoniomyces obsoletus]